MNGSEVPAPLAGAMMGQGKKPFTYLPGGIDFSELKSSKMAKRIAKHQAGIPTRTGSVDRCLLSEPAEEKNMAMRPAQSMTPPPISIQKAQLPEQNKQRSISNLLTWSDDQDQKPFKISTPTNNFQYNPYSKEGNMCLPPKTPNTIQSSSQCNGANYSKPQMPPLNLNNDITSNQSNSCPSSPSMKRVVRITATTNPPAPSPPPPPLPPADFLNIEANNASQNMQNVCGKVKGIHEMLRQEKEQKVKEKLEEIEFEKTKVNKLQAEDLIKLDEVSNSCSKIDLAKNYEQKLESDYLNELEEFKKEQLKQQKELEQSKQTNQININIHADEIQNIKAEQEKTKNLIKTMEEQRKKLEKAQQELEGQHNSREIKYNNSINKASKCIQGGYLDSNELLCQEQIEGSQEKQQKQYEELQRLEKQKLIVQQQEQQRQIAEREKQRQISEQQEQQRQIAEQERQRQIAETEKQRQIVEQQEQQRQVAEQKRLEQIAEQQEQQRQIAEQKRQQQMAAYQEKLRQIEEQKKQKQIEEQQEKHRLHQEKIFEEKKRIEKQKMEILEKQKHEQEAREQRMRDEAENERIRILEQKYLDEENKKQAQLSLRQFHSNSPQIEGCYQNRSNGFMSNPTCYFQNNGFNHTVFDGNSDMFSLSPPVMECMDDMEIQPSLMDNNFFNPIIESKGISKFNNLFKPNLVNTNLNQMERTSSTDSKSTVSKNERIIPIQIEKKSLQQVSPSSGNQNFQYKEQEIMVKSPVFDQEGSRSPIMPPPSILGSMSNNTDEIEKKNSFKKPLVRQSSLPTETDSDRRVQQPFYERGASVDPITSKKNVIGELNSYGATSASQISGFRRVPRQSPSMNLLGMIHNRRNSINNKDRAFHAPAQSQEYSGDKGRYLPPKTKPQNGLKDYVDL